MHLDFYELGTDPFRLTPDYRFAYPHRAYQAARESMQEVLSRGDGVLVLSGRAGTGKTTLVQEFLESISGDKVSAATVVGTPLAEGGFLQLVAHAFDLNPRYDHREELLALIQRHLGQVGKALLVVDEAQNLSEATLEELGLLSCLELGPGRQLQIFLVGQEGLPAKLDAPAVAQLRQRVSTSCLMTELDLQECSDYVMHRLAVAGWCGRPAIAAGVMVLLHRFSQGLPRHLCKLCSRLLLHGAVAEKNHLDVSDVAAVVDALREEMLLPNVSGAASNRTEGTAGLHDVGELGTGSLEDILTLTSQEKIFLAEAPAVFELSRSMESVPEAVAEPLAEPVAEPVTVLDVEIDSARRSPVGAALADASPATGTIESPAGVLQQGAYISSVRRKRLAGIPVFAAAALLALIAFGYFFRVSPEPEHTADETGNSAVAPAKPVIRDGASVVSPADVESVPTPPQQVARLEFITPQAVAIDPLAPVAEESLAEIVTTGRSIAPAGPDRPEPTGLEQGEQAAGGAAMDQTIEALLALGQRALESNYLTTPEETSAYHYYQAVLELDPDNEIASSGMVAIADLYAVMANTMLERRNLRNAGVFIRRGLFVLPEHPPLIALRWQLDREMAGSKTASASAVDIEELAPAAL